jgi:Cu/Ag efflux protein CusF
MPILKKDSLMIRLMIVVGAAAILAAAAFAQTSKDQGASAATSSGTQAGAPMSEGEVRKVDKDGGKLTIKHGPLANLEMPGMTMVFRVKDPGMLDQVKEGDKIKFVADRVNGAITVVQLEVVK